MPLDDCPVLCWAFRHYDTCIHTDPITDDQAAIADEERRYDR